MQKLYDTVLAGLSPLSLVATELWELHRPHLAWSNGEHVRITPAVMASAVPVEALSKRKVVGLAEMYGGAGIGANAGGVRCANIQGVQFKGIGCNQLAGITTDKWHKHGALSLQDAIKETLMGEIFHVAAPYGAVRCRAIYDLKQRFATEIGVDKTPSSAPQAVVERDGAVRLAHFMRSYFVNAGDESVYNDTARMRDGVPRLVNALLSGAPLPRGGININALFDAVLRIFTRILEQIAALRMKRLVHGSLIPSNIGIDGRLLDFTTATAVSTLHPVLVAPGSYSSHEQHIQVIESAGELLFYLIKFDGRINIGRREFDGRIAILKDRLNCIHTQSLLHHHLSIFGFSVAEIMQLQPAVKNSLIRCAIDLISAGETAPCLYFGGDEHKMRAQAGVNDIFAAVAYAILRCEGKHLAGSDSYNPAPDAFSQHLLCNLYQTYTAAIEEINFSVDRKHAAAARLIRSVQRNADLSPLYRRALDGEINEIAEKRGADIGDYVNSMLRDWLGIFYTPASGTINLEGWLTQDAWSIRSDHAVCKDGRPTSYLDFLEARPSSNVRPRHLWALDAAKELCH